MTRMPAILTTLGALLVILLAIAAGRSGGARFADRLDRAAEAVLAPVAGHRVAVDFGQASGWPTRHALLTAAPRLSESLRAEAARTVAAVPGVGGVHWAGSSARAAGAGSAAPPPVPLHCQDDVEALLRARSIRFEESSAAIAPASRELIAEVAQALRPCLGAIIAITGHTDNSGPEPGNLALSLERAVAIRNALVARGIPADGLRARGLGSQAPVAGLAPSDPANRRIEFSVLATAPIEPTVVDTPGAR